jgi:TolB protein
VALDERLRRELDRAAQPADPSGLYEHLIRRRERRRIAQRVQGGLLAVVVLVGSIGGFVALTRIFRETEKPPPVASPTVSNGVIVFSLPLEDGGEHVFAVGADGSGLRQVTPEGRAVYRSPDVSPDGRSIVVVHEIPSFEPGLSVLATVPIEGGSPTWLTEPHVFRDPVWSPDGSKIAFAGSIEDPFGIYVLDVASGQGQPVPGTDEISVGHPTWSPNGARIAFEASMGSDTDPAQSWDIYSVAVDGSGMTNLTNTPDVSETQPAWSWVRDRIAFVETGPAEGALLTMSSTGADATTAYSGELSPANPVWSPDGTAIAFEGGSEGIVTVRTDGTDFTSVSDALGGDPAWQPLAEGTSIDVPPPTPSPTPQAGEDIGLGLRLCEVTSVRGTFLSAYGEDQSAFVGMVIKPGGSCSRGGLEVEGVAAIDVTGDGVVDFASDPFTCQGGCHAFAAPDVDGDGNDELLVQNVEFTIVGLKLFEVVPNEDEPALVAVTVAPPGDAPFGYEGFEAGEEPQFWIGGDAFIADAIRCEAGEGGRLFISTTGESRPHDSPDARTYATETTFDLVGSELRVLSVRETVDDPSAFVTTGCGADLNPYS